MFRPAPRLVVQARGRPLPGPSVDTPCPMHRVAIDHSPEGEHVASFRAEYDVLSVHGSFYPAALIWSFEMAGQLVAILFELNRLGLGFSVPVFRIDCPVAFNVGKSRLWRSR